MRILYGAGNYIGSNIIASRFLKNAPNHQIKIAGYYRNHKYLNTIDWCLDALYQTKFGTKNYFLLKHGVKGPLVNHDIADVIINDILEFEPELVISDCEIFTAFVAKALEIPLWYCSPMLQLVGIEREYRDILLGTFRKTKEYIASLPEADAYLVYSPLCDILSRPILKNTFEWVRPYYETPVELSTESIDFSTFSRALPEGSLISTGETSFVADCLYSGRSFCVSPNPNEQEQLLNAQLLQYYNVAVNIGRPRTIEVVKRKVEKKVWKPVLSIQKWKSLDERIEDGL